MKRKIFLLIIMMMSLQLSSQDHGSWVIPPYQIDFYDSGPVVNEIFPVPQPYYVSTAAFKENGDLLFYIIDNRIYNSSSVEIGSLYLGISQQYEVEIINVPGQNDTYYIIYGWLAPYTGEIRYAKIDCSTPEPTLVYDNLITQTFQHAAFAVTEGSDNSRDLYIVAWSLNQNHLAGLFKYSITSSGISYTSTIVDQNNPIFNDPVFFRGHNLELSPDELTLAWCVSNNETEKLYIVNLTQQGTFLSGAKVQLNNLSIMGIEFASDLLNQSLYMSCFGTNGGIYQFDYSTNQVIGKLNNSDAYSQTFLQTAADGYIYAVSNNGENLGRINTINNTFTPQVITSVNILSYLMAGGGTIYKIPNDKKLYSMLDIEMSSTYITCPGASDGSATATPIGGTPPYSYYWTQGGQTTQTITNLPEGTYQCCITDAIDDEVCDDIDVILTPGLFDFDYELVFDQPYPITLNDWQYTFKTGFRVRAGSNITMVDCDLQFAKDAKVIIEQGGKLTLSNTTFSNFTICEGMWQGIEVWGNREANQWPDAQGNYEQGYLELIDAVIENAIVAVSLWKPGEYSSSGGIVEARNTVFSNNKRSVHAVRYTNFHPVNGKEMDYRATFTRCKFELDVDYPGLETFYKHVDLDRVRGVKFSACEFSLSPDVPNVSLYNMAIGSYSAGFTVNAICADTYVPCQTYDHSTFTGFHWAINANNNLGSNRTFFVNQALFDSNAYGIYTSGINNFTVLNSEFNIGYNEPESDPCDSDGKAASSYGIHMTGCTGFAIEDNEFYKTAGEPQGKYTGIYIAETQAADQVYKNTFDGLSYGNYAVGKNWKDPYTWQGLAYYCNENVGNTQDIKVVKNIDDPPIGGVQNPIGSSALPSGNTFSTNADYHIYNDGSYWFGYFYYAPSPGYTSTPYYPAKVHRVTREEVVGIQNQCPSNYGGGGSSSTRDVVMTPAQMQQAEMEYAAGLSDYNNVKTLYDNLKDGGSTTATMTDIATAWPSDMWELRAGLLGKSPHLSMEVLKATADRTDVLPESVIFEIMAANPDELKKEELIKYLEDKDNPLPEYMVDILRQVAMGSSYKTVLQRQMAHYGQLKSRAAHNIIRSLLNDTISNNDELRNWLDNIGGKRADEQIIASYLSEGNFTNALALANMMPALYNYTGNEVTEHNYYMEILNLQITLEQQQRCIFDLDSLEVANLLYITENNHGTAGVQAKGILEYAYGYHFCNCIEADESGLKSGKPFNPASLEKLSGIEITVVPNPAKDWAAFNYTLPENATSGVIVISDAAGREVASMPVSGKQGQQIWDTRRVKPGVYFYTLSAGGFSKHGKIVINK
jgi:hypothetical protein